MLAEILIWFYLLLPPFLIITILGFRSSLRRTKLFWESDRDYIKKLEARGFHLLAEVKEPTCDHCGVGEEQGTLRRFCYDCYEKVWTELKISYSEDMERLTALEMFLSIKGEAKLVSPSGTKIVLKGRDLRKSIDEGLDKRLREELNGK